MIFLALLEAQCQLEAVEFDKSLLSEEDVTPLCEYLKLDNQQRTFAIETNPNLNTDSINLVLESIYVSSIKELWLVGTGVDERNVPGIEEFLCTATKLERLDLSENFLSKASLSTLYDRLGQLNLSVILSTSLSKQKNRNSGPSLNKYTGFGSIEEQELFHQDQINLCGSNNPNVQFIDMFKFGGERLERTYIDKCSRGIIIIVYVSYLNHIYKLYIWLVVFCSLDGEKVRKL
eukprot:snap_masked-scaffold_56-processed-gene-0.18-mRNA-1 protein AED:1.00 eAED:1.00 QI:0/0/0/0/1/1/3/0/232